MLNWYCMGAAHFEKNAVDLAEMRAEMEKIKAAGNTDGGGGAEPGAAGRRTQQADDEAAALADAVKQFQHGHPNAHQQSSGGHVRSQASCCCL